MYSPYSLSSKQSSCWSPYSQRWSERGPAASPSTTKELKIIYIQTSSGGDSVGTTWSRRQLRIATIILRFNGCFENLWALFPDNTDLDWRSMQNSANPSCPTFIYLLHCQSPNCIHCVPTCSNMFQAEAIELQELRLWRLKAPRHSGVVCTQSSKASSDNASKSVGRTNQADLRAHIWTLSHTARRCKSSFRVLDFSLWYVLIETYWNKCVDLCILTILATHIPDMSGAASRIGSTLLFVHLLHKSS